MRRNLSLHLRAMLPGYTKKRQRQFVMFHVTNTDEQNNQFAGRKWFSSPKLAISTTKNLTLHRGLSTSTMPSSWCIAQYMAGLPGKAKRQVRLQTVLLPLGRWFSSGFSDPLCLQRYARVCAQTETRDRGGERSRRFRRRTRCTSYCEICFIVSALGVGDNRCGNGVHCVCCRRSSLLGRIVNRGLAASSGDHFSSSQ